MDLSILDSWLSQVFFWEQRPTAVLLLMIDWLLLCDDGDGPSSLAAESPSSAFATTLHHPQHSVTPITALPIRCHRLQYPPGHRAVEEFLVQKRVSTVIAFEQSTMRLFVKLLANFSGLASEDPWANHVRDRKASCRERVSSPV